MLRRINEALTVGLRVCVITCALLAWCGSAHADGRRGFHQKAYAVPAPGKVTIDGKLDDWDLSGQILVSVTDETAQMQSARFAMMYDKDALYISAVVRDTTPLLNRHDPQIDPAWGWDGDACQIYLTTDAAMEYPVNKGGGATYPDMMDMYLWNFTNRNEPALACFQGMDWTPLHPDWKTNGAIPADKFEGAYAKAADGRGYTMEYRIPWGTLGAKKPLKAGDLVAGLVQFDWSDSTGLKTAGGGAWAYDVMGRPGFPWQDSGCWGKIIFSRKGKLSPDLVEEGLPPAKPLPLTYGFDLPEDAEATIQFWNENGVLARTLVASAPRRAGHNVESWDGLDAMGVPLAAGHYIVKGLYHQPITTKFLFSAHNSGQPPYHTDDGTGSWGGDHGNPTSVCALSDGMILTWQMSEAGFGIIKTDFNGKKLWGTKHNAADIASDGKRLFVVGDAAFEGSLQPKVFDARDCRPLNWGNGKLTLDPPPGGEAGDDIAAAISYLNGKVYVSWPLRNAVGVYDSTSGDPIQFWTVPAPGHLAARPDGTVVIMSENKILAVGAQGSTVLINDHVDLAQNKCEVIQGIPQPHNGITVGPDGTIYVANSGKLQDISVFDAQGKYLRSIGTPGGRPARGRYDRNGVYEPGGIALDKNGQLWVAETTDYPKRFSVWDAANGNFAHEFFGGSAYYGWVYMDPRHPDEIYCHNVIWKVDWKNNTCEPYSTIWRPTAPNEVTNVGPSGYQGQLRVWTLKDGSQISYGNTVNQVVVSKRDGDLFKPFLAQIRLMRTGLYTQPMYNEVSGELYSLFHDHNKWPDGTYYWWDANNDQTIQESEISKDDTQFKQYLGNLGNTLAGPEDLEAGTIGLDDSRQTWDLTRWDRPPSAKDSKIAWAYRGGVAWQNSINLPPEKPGDMFALTLPLGTAGQFTGAASYFGVFQIVTKDDGVYVAQLFRDGRLGGGLGPDTLAAETLMGELVKPDGMNRTFLLGGAADGRVTEVLGLDTVKRLPDGVFDFTQEQAQIAGAAIAEYRAKIARTQRLTIVRGRRLLDTASPVGKIINAQRSFSARAARDADNLYVRYDVTSESELTNSMPDPHLIFKGGNLLDIQLATDAAADPKRKTPAPGDLRLLVTRQDGKPVAVLFRPRLRDFHGQPIVLKSPGNQEPFDSIEPVDVAMDYQKTGSGFTAVVTIPLKLLGWTPQPGQEVKMDLGYVFGNALGNQTSARAYWSNNGFSANIINDVPNESRLEPNLWGEANVE